MFSLELNLKNDDYFYIELVRYNKFNQAMQNFMSDHSHDFDESDRNMFQRDREVLFSLTVDYDLDNLSLDFLGATYHRGDPAYLHLIADEFDFSLDEYRWTEDPLEMRLRIGSRTVAYNCCSPKDYLESEGLFKKFKRVIKSYYLDVKTDPDRYRFKVNH